VGGDVSVDSETLLVTDFVNLKIKPTQSFRGDYRGRVCICVFIGMDARTCMNICISQKRKSFLQTGHKKTFMGINWCKEVHCNLNYDGVELQREEKMKPENKSAVYIMVGSIQVLI
jgi:hypothetical protein